MSNHATSTHIGLSAHPCIRSIKLGLFCLGVGGCGAEGFAGARVGGSAKGGAGAEDHVVDDGVEDGGIEDRLGNGGGDDDTGKSTGDDGVS